jgi:MoaA/NifB/PqqE/SkfB family radical SAM enzyme
MKREKGFMEFALFKKIIDEGCEIGVKRIHLYLHGEPLLHPKIVDMIRFIKYKNLGISIATNGMVLNKELSSDILKTGVNSADYFTFSILGASKEIHEKIMKGVDHERVINNILNFIEMRKKMKKNGPIIEVIFYSMPENDGEEDLFRNIWKGYVDHVRLGGKISQQFAKYKNERNKILERKKTCNNLWERMTIFWDGRVTICIGDIDGDEIIGDLRKMKIDEVWNGENLLKIKMLHLEKKFRELNLCFNCDW